jgi:hypothetical protein
LAQSVKRSGKVSSFHGELARIWRWWSLITSHLQLCSVCWGAGTLGVLQFQFYYTSKSSKGASGERTVPCYLVLSTQESSANENHVSVTCFIFNYGRIVLVFRWTIGLKFEKNSASKNNDSIDFQLLGTILKLHAEWIVFLGLWKGNSYCHCHPMHSLSYPLSN